MRTTTTARAAALGVVAALATSIALAPGATAAPAVPASLPAQVDALARYEPATTCAGLQPGTAALRDLIRTAYGRQTIGTVRACPVGTPVNSEHMDGRAVDWMLDVRDPAQRATAEEFLGWLLGPGATGDSATAARRLGVMYVIWDGRIWGSYRAAQGWQPYTGPDAHSDHIHISLSRRGAARETSWWTGETSPVAGHWVALGGTRSVLGAPVSGERASGAGTRRDYAGGTIFASAATQAREVHGAIAAHYLQGGRPGALGLPVTDELPTPRGGGRFNHFSAGSVYWSRATGAHEVRGAIRDAWAAQGWELGRLGFPTSDEHAVAGGRRSDFTGGSITWTAATGEVVVRLT